MSVHEHEDEPDTTQEALYWIDGLTKGATTQMSKINTSTPPPHPEETIVEFDEEERR